MHRLVNPLDVARRNRRYATDRIDLRFADRGLKATATGDSPLCGGIESAGREPRLNGRFGVWRGGEEFSKFRAERPDLWPAFFPNLQLDR